MCSSVPPPPSLAVWSMAKHGPTEVLVERLKPLLEQHNVSAYFSGHDHNLQYIQEADSNVSYFVVGAGHLTDPSDDHKVRSSSGQEIQGL